MIALMAVFPIVSALFALIPAITLPADQYTTLISAAFDILGVVLYVLPAPTVVIIFSIVMGLNLFRIVVSFVKTLWDLLPLV